MRKMLVIITQIYLDLQCFKMKYYEKAIYF